jgi:ribosomal-protein-alanine N-acetyltransferase
MSPDRQAERGQAEASGQQTSFADMTVMDLDQVCAIEARAYSFPWSRGNFTDSLASGYLAQRLLARPLPASRRAESGPLCLGYFVAMPGVEEMHLLNITVVPEQQGQGHAQCMLAHLVRHCQARAARHLWLEVRESNVRARRLYERWGFETVGRRKAYYPAAGAEREDAIVMRLSVGLQNGEGPG